MYQHYLSIIICRWKTTNSSSTFYKHNSVIRLDGRSICRGWHQNQLLPGNTDQSGKCQVGFFGRLYGINEYQVLVDPGDTSRLEWRKWNIFTKLPIGLVAFVEEDAFVARHSENGEYRFGDLSPRRGLSGDIAIFPNRDQVQYFTEGGILVEVEPVKYNLDDLDFITRRVKVSKEEVQLGSRILSNVIVNSAENNDYYDLRLMYGWDLIRSVITYNATYNYYWGQFPGLIKALPSSSQTFGSPHKMTFKWGLPLSFTRHRILEVSRVLQPGTSVQVSASAWKTTTEVPFTAKLVAIYEDGKRRKKQINGTYLETVLSEVKTDYGAPYYTHNGTQAPTTTTTTTSTSVSTTDSPTLRTSRRPPGFIKLSTPRPRRTTTPIPTEPNPLLRFYPQFSNNEFQDEDSEIEKDKMQSDQASLSQSDKRSPMTESLINSGNTLRNISLQVYASLFLLCLLS